MADRTFKQVQAEVMQFARKNGLSEPDAIAMLRRELKREGIAMPEKMATDAQFKKQRESFEKGDPVSKTNMATAKAQMRNGGMANGKKHMYVGGGDVTDKLPNKGLKMLAKTPKGRAAVRNMGFNV